MPPRVVHARARHGHAGREQEEHRRDNHVRQPKEVDGPTERRRQAERRARQRAPCRQRTGIGIPYDSLSATTDAEVMALNAVLDPRKMRSNAITTPIVRLSALSGTLSRGWILAKNVENGISPSRANA